ncbi:MAG: Smr/MutS family protein [Paracoccaceae bacterium]
MSRRKPRGLRPDEEDLWDKVRHSAVPLHPDKKSILRDAVERMKPAPPIGTMPSFTVGEAAPSKPTTHDLAPALSDHLAGSHLQMDRKRFGRMQKGKLVPERRIDLHGMTIARAHPTLLRFILDAHADGLRLVLVITGKGRNLDDAGPIPVKRGVLKHQVPHWLHSAPLKPLVLQVSEAHLKHGGSGAYYVYLRRTR